MSLDAHAFVRSEISKLRDALDALGRDSYPGLLSTVAEVVVDSLQGGGKVMFCGNGGSAADAQHLAAELVGRQNFDRPAAAGLALTVDTSALTAVGNDYGYEDVFSRQVEALGRPGDVLFGISTSGRSPNVVRALAAARAAGITTVAGHGRCRPCRRRSRRRNGQDPGAPHRLRTHRLCAGRTGPVRELAA